MSETLNYWSTLVKVAEKLYKESLELGIPAISFTDGLILSLTTFSKCSTNDYVTVVDGGAGVGFSTLFLAYGMSMGCKGLLTAVEWDRRRFERLKVNAKILEKFVGEYVVVEVIEGDFLEYLENVSDESLDVAFIDVEKRVYPIAARLLKRKLRRGGVALFHNAITPRPPPEFFEVVLREFKSIIVPTDAGILVAFKA